MVHQQQCHIVGGYPRAHRVVDVVQGYYQVLLEEESRHLTIFLLPPGRFRFKRTPMGMVCSSYFFNYCSDRILAPVPNKVKIVDDGLVQHIEEQPAYSRIREVCKAQRTETESATAPSPIVVT